MVGMLLNVVYGQDQEPKTHITGKPDKLCCPCSSLIMY